MTRARNEDGCARQLERFKGTRLFTNADMTLVEIRVYGKLDGASTILLQIAMQRM